MILEECQHTYDKRMKEVMIQHILVRKGFKLAKEPPQNSKSIIQEILQKPTDLKLVITTWHKMQIMTLVKHSHNDQNDRYNIVSDGEIVVLLSSVRPIVSSLQLD